MITKVPEFIRRFYPNRLWKVATEEKVIYLTFDDGPIPEITPWVLQQLEKYNAIATFFCIGDNVKKHPEIFRQLIFEGHSIGNHTFNHLNGWKTSTEEYLKNTVLAEGVILREEEMTSEKRAGKKEPNFLLAASTKQQLFRPPYGRITGKQAKLIQKRNYKIVMWDVLSRDYNHAVSPEKCFQNVIKHTTPGSVIVFHDSLKAEKNLKVVLPRVLEYYSSIGFTFGKI